MTEPVTSDEYAAALKVYNAAPDWCPKGELRELVSRAVAAVRSASGQWGVYAESYDIPGIGRVISVHDSEADALLECQRLNRENPSDAGVYGIHQVMAR